MSLEPGGLAEKIGNRYESSWVAFQLLRLLDEKISYVQVEPIGPDEDAVDVIIGNLDGSKEHHQCKIGNLSDNAWTLATLQSKQLLTKGLQHILSGSKSYKVVSRIGFRLLEDICESARNSTNSSSEFFEYQIKNISPDRLKLFNELCSRLNLDSSNLDDLDKAIQFLKSFEIKKFNEDDIDNELCILLAEKLVYQPPSHLVHFLQTYPVKCGKLRTRITSHTLKADLEVHHFSFKTYPGHPHISDVIATLNDEFDRSIEPYLISQQNIQRAEFSTTLDTVNNNPITIIKADAGVGKSAFLLDLKKHFVQSGTIVLPIRLDRRVPEKNLDQFGKDLGFPYSPIACLEKYGQGQEIIILLDQLDALRWTALHSSNALDICIKMVKEILLLRQYAHTNIKIIMATRNFELEDDVRLRNWISEINSDVKQMELKLFEPDQIKPYVSQFEDYDQLSNEQQNILKIPLWLGIYMDLANDLGCAPKFTTKLDLIKFFIDDRFKQLTDSHGISTADSENFFNEIVNLMDQTKKLSVSSTQLSIGSSEIKKAMISVGLLTEQNREISFRHQAIHDYAIGKKLYSQGLSSPEDFLHELGSKNQQTLLKREHLRYALAMLYEADERAFCNCIEAVLFHSEIRFHLKSLVFSTLRHIENFKAPLKKLINKIISDSDLAPHFIRLSCSGCPTLVQYLSENQYLSDWLDEDDEMQSKALELLSSVSDKAPNLLINELSKFVNRSPEWNQKIYNCLCWKMSDDSEELFNLRIELIQNGVSSRYIFWDDLTKEYPLRALHLLKLMCNEELYTRLSSREEWSDYDTESIEKLAESHSQDVLRIFLPFLDQYFSEPLIEDFDAFKWSEEYAVRTSFETFIYKALFTLVIKASQNMALQSTELFQLLIPLKNNSNLIFNRIYANALLNLEIDHTDFVIEWLLDNPNHKFKLGNDNEEPVWKLAGKLIEKFSPHCTLENFELIQNTIYYIHSEYNLDQIKWRLEATRKNYYAPYWGKTQFYLLPKLDTSRISNKSTQLISVLNRKFAKYTDDDFCHRSNSLVNTIKSPIKDAGKLSSKAWKKLILTDPKEFKGFKFDQESTECSIQQFSSNFRSAVNAEPKRFAEFALKLPKHIHQDYIDALYSGLSENNLDQVPDHLKEQWSPCPIEWIEQVIDHFPAKNYSRALQQLLSGRVKLLSPKYLKLLEDIALSADDPLLDKLNIHKGGQPNQIDEISSHDLYGNTLNCTRGSAYKGLAKKFWDDKEYALSHKHIIENALNDEHAAVRMATADLLLPMYNYDRNYAFQKFVELCKKDLRNTLSNGYYYYFNKAFDIEFKESFIALVQMMVSSPYQDVRKEGHKQVIARWLFNGLFEEELKQGLESKNHESLLGYASVISQLLGNDTKGYDHQKMKRIFNILVNSENEEILKNIGRFFNQKFWSKRYAREFFYIYIHSKALNHNIYNVLHSIEESSMNMAQFSDLIIIMIQNILKLNTQELVSRMDVDTITRVIQRLYDQAENDKDDETLDYCLDMLDELLASNHSFTRNMTDKLDFGLLA
ncbi:hypothetical protein NQ999_10815 [Acinetobacter baumannii]|uniref:hypothetical protein n=1 Tax=Acinetobacter baumannii TaxID=470 RepID=UPI0022B4F2F8|nr:hypothetical protein [Acinetobacter baumannii]MDC5011310.1 hypothetical protein [Acinetobacter baumannii]MDC5053633.1 hypothetical protein [Acinetobacter baumannii]MDV4251927.1 hypothetical protein [Acinetobacter baumannii]